MKHSDISLRRMAFGRRRAWTLGSSALVKIIPVVALMSGASSALACSCILPAGSQSDHVRREFRESEAIFSAYVQSIHHADLDGHRTRMAKLRVLQVWKGKLQPNTWIDVVSDENTGLADCGYAASSDHALMVYAHGQEPYRLASCSLTGPLERATSDIPLLNKLSRRQPSS